MFHLPETNWDCGDLVAGEVKLHQGKFSKICVPNTQTHMQFNTVYSIRVRHFLRVFSTTKKGRKTKKIRIIIKAVFKGGCPRSLSVEVVGLDEQNNRVMCHDRGTFFHVYSVTVYVFVGQTHACIPTLKVHKIKMVEVQKKKKSFSTV